MVQDFFDALDAEERKKAKETTDILVNLLQEWALQYSFVRTIRIFPVALHNATVASRLDIRGSALLAKLTLWIFGIDDAIDEGLISLEDLQQRVIGQWYRAACGSSPERADSSDELVKMLLDVREELSNYRLFDSLQERWSANVRLLAKAMARECQYRSRYIADGSVTLPSVDEYVKNGIFSTGIPLWALAILIILDEPAVRRCFDLMYETAKCASGAVRLYNDFQTFDKEMQENNVNSIIIKYHEILDRDPCLNQKTALSEAKNHTLKMAESYMQRCFNLAKQIQTKSRKYEDTMCRMPAFHATFYQEYDYHITLASQVNEFLGVPT